MRKQRKSKKKQKNKMNKSLVCWCSLLLHLSLAQTPDRFTTSMELIGVSDSILFTSLSHELTKVRISPIDLKTEFADRINVLSKELSLASSMHTSISAAATAMSKNLHDMNAAVARFVRAEKSGTPTQEPVLEVDRCATASLQAASALSFAVHHGKKSLDESDHALEALIKSTQTRETSANQTLTVLEHELQRMVDVQQEVDHEIATTQSSIIHNLPNGNVRKETLPQLFDIGNVSFHENDMRTKRLLGAMRNITLAKYYVDTLAIKMSVLIEQLVMKRKQERNVFDASTRQVCKAMESMLQQLSIQVHLAHDGNVTALNLLSDGVVPETSIYTSVKDIWYDSNLRLEKQHTQKYYKVDLHEMFTMLRLALQSEHAAEAVSVIVDNIRTEQEREADQAMTELLHQAVLRSHASGEKLKQWTPPGNGLDAGTKSGEKLLQDMLTLAEDDLNKGHLKSVQDYVGGQIVVEDEGTEESSPDNSDESGVVVGDDELSLEEKEAKLSAEMAKREKQQDEKSVSDMRNKVEKEQVAAAQTKEESNEASTMEDIIQTQDAEMSMLRKTREEQEIETNSKDEYSLLKLLESMRAKVEQKASDAIDLQGHASTSWEMLHEQLRGSQGRQRKPNNPNNTSITSNNTTTHELNVTRNIAVNDQIYLADAIHHVVEQMSSSNKVEERLSSARAKSLVSEVSRAKEELQGDTDAAGVEKPTQAQAQKENENTVLETSKVAAVEQNIVESLVAERSRASIDAELDAERMAKDRASAASEGKETSSLLASLLVAKTRYATVMSRMVGEHKVSAHAALQDATKEKKRMFQKKIGKYRQSEKLSEKTLLLSKQDKEMDIAKKEFVGFFKRPFTKEELAKEISGEV